MTDEETIPVDEEFGEHLLRLSEAHRSIYLGGGQIGTEHKTIENMVAAGEVTRADLELAHDLADELREFTVEDFHFKSREMESFRRVLDGLASEHFGRLLDENRGIDADEYEF